MKGRTSIFDLAYLLCYKCHEINRNCDGSYVDSPDWIKNKKATINSVNKNDNKCFQYSSTFALNHTGIEKHS